MTWPPLPSSFPQPRCGSLDSGSLALERNGRVKLGPGQMADSQQFGPFTGFFCSFSSIYVDLRWYKNFRTVCHVWFVGVPCLVCNIYIYMCSQETVWEFAPQAFCRSEWPEETRCKDLSGHLGALEDQLKAAWRGWKVGFSCVMFSSNEWMCC